MRPRTLVLGVVAAFIVNLSVGARGDGEAPTEDARRSAAADVRRQATTDADELTNQRYAAGVREGITKGRATVRRGTRAGKKIWRRGCREAERTFRPALRRLGHVPRVGVRAATPPVQLDWRSARAGYRKLRSSPMRSGELDSSAFD